MLRMLLTWEYMPSGLLLSLKKSKALFVILHLLHTLATSAAEPAMCACKVPGCASSGFSPRVTSPTCKAMHLVMALHAPCCGVLLLSLQIHAMWQMRSLRVVWAHILSLSKLTAVLRHVAVACLCEVRRSCKIDAAVRRRILDAL